jgi:hypothetical protein
MIMSFRHLRLGLGFFPHYRSRGKEKELGGCGGGDELGDEKDYIHLQTMRSGEYCRIISTL